MSRLKGYQKKTVNSVVKRLKSGTTDGVIIADEVGLGKTWEVFGILDEIKRRDQRVLIVTPNKDLIQHWISLMGDYSKGRTTGFVAKQYNKVFKILENKKGKVPVNKLLLFKPRKHQRIFFFPGSEVKSKSFTFREKIHLFECACQQVRKAKTMISLIGRKRWRIYSRLLWNFNPTNNAMLKREFERFIRRQERDRIFKERLVRLIFQYRLKPNIVVIDEFHNYPEFRNAESFNKIGVWKLLLGTDSQSSVKAASTVYKIFLSATPFKPVGVIDEGNMDILSPVLANIINKYRENDTKYSTSKRIQEYNRSVLELRDTINSADATDPVRSLVEKIMPQKIAIERELRKYIIENKRLVRDHRWDDLSSKKWGNVRSESNFNSYLEYHGKIFDARKERARMFNIPQAEQLFTAGWQTLFNGKDLILPSQIFGARLTDKNTHIYKRLLGINTKQKNNKIERYSALILSEFIRGRNIKKGLLPLWIQPDKNNQVEKSVTYCYFTRTPFELEERLSEAMPLQFKNAKSFKLAKKQKVLLDHELTEMYSKIGLNEAMIQKEDFVNSLIKYLTSPYAYRVISNEKGNTYADKVVAYIKKNDLMLTIREYLNRGGNIQHLINTFENVHIPLYKYGATHGGGIKSGQQAKELYDEQLRNAFNTPFFPFVLISTNIGAEGIDLHKYCRNVVHYDVWWMPSRLEQRVGRVDRVSSYIYKLRKNRSSNISQKSHVLDETVEVYLPQIYNKDNYKIRVYYMAMDDMVDEYILDRALERKIWTSLFMGGAGLERLLKGSAKKTYDDDKSLKELNRLIIDLSPR